LNTAQQIGGALGLAILTTIATTVANDRLPGAAGALYEGLARHDAGLVARAGAAVTEGYTTAFVAAAAMFLGGLVVTALAVNAGRQRDGEGAAAPVHMG
jgi:hypothetical protein